VETPITPFGLAVRPSTINPVCHEPIPENFGSFRELAKYVGIGLGITVAEYALLIFLISLAAH
jgi:hypothetical protein